MVQFFKSNYTARNTLISVAGNIKHPTVQDLAARYFSQLQTGDPTDPGAPPVVHPARDIRRKSGKVREFTEDMLEIGRPPSIHFPDKACGCRLEITLKAIVDRISIATSAFRDREKRGLVYSIYSNLDLYRDAGALVVYAGTAPGSAAAVVELVLKEFRNLREELVPSEELNRSKENI